MSDGQSEGPAAAPTMAEPVDDGSTPIPEIPVEDATKTINLDASRKARREKRGAQPAIVFLERSWTLPYGIPADVIEKIADINSGDFTKVVDAVDCLLGGRYLEVKKAAAATGDPLELDDLTFLLEGALEIYGVTLPGS